MENKRISFFSRAKRAITKFDEYDVFLTEKTSVAIFYYIKLLLIISIVLGLVITYQIVTLSNNVLTTAKEKIPEFVFEDYTLKMNDNEPVVITDAENDVYVIIDSKTEDNEKINEYKEKMNEHKLSFLLLNKKVLYKTDSIVECNYNDIMNESKIENISFTKDDAIKYIDENIMQPQVYFGVYLIVVIVAFIILAISSISDLIILTLLGIITSRIIKIRFNISSIISLAIYSITLPLLLLMLYTIASITTNFNIEFFNIIYTTIGYIYIIAAILIIKSNIITQNIEVSKIVELQEQVKKEMEEEEEKKEENQETKEDENKEKDNQENEKSPESEVDSNEPDGSEI